MPKQARRKNALITAAQLPLVLGGFAFSVTGDGTLPDRIRIAAWGKNIARGDKPGQDVEFHVGDLTAAQLPQEQAKRGWDTVSGDFEHESVAGHPNYKPNPRDYWAHGRLEVVKGQGLDYIPASYTPAGVKHAASYADVSGYFFLDPKTRQVIAVKSVALCEHGRVEGARNLQAIAAALGDNLDLPPAVMELVSFAKDLLDLDDAASLDDVRDGLKQMVAIKNSEDQTTETDLTNQPATDMEKKEVQDIVSAAIAESQKATNESIGKLLTAVQGLTASQVTSQHNSAVEIELTAAVAAGKKVPDSLKKKDEAGKYIVPAEMVKEIAAALPVTVSVQFRTPEQIAAAQGQMQQLQDADVTQLCAALGIKVEDFNKQQDPKTATVIAGNAPLAGTEKKFTATA